MNRVFSNNANPNSRNDFLGDELKKYGKKATVKIAVAFFTDHQFIKTLVDNGCSVQLIVRLRPPTSAYSLNKILHLKDVYIRYYTANEFHPKLYIFGYKIAFIGSSNLTNSGLVSNQELNISAQTADMNL